MQLHPHLNNMHRNGPGILEAWANRSVFGHGMAKHQANLARPDVISRPGIVQADKMGHGELHPKAHELLETMLCHNMPTDMIYIKLYMCNMCNISSLSGADDAAEQCDASKRSRNDGRLASNWKR